MNSARMMMPFSTSPSLRREVRGEGEESEQFMIASLARIRRPDKRMKKGKPGALYQPEKTLGASICARQHDHEGREGNKVPLE
jgi:hypothetical protein